MRFLSIVPLLLLLGCSDDKEYSSQTLSLALGEHNGRLHVVDYQVRNNAFVKSQQQGRYQAHIFDDNGNLLQKINFERIELSSANNANPEIDFYVAMPLLEQANWIEIYMLDGSSGHYQLKTDNPLLKWQLPKGIALESQSVKE
ncbi:hypothetical protein [Fodinibius sp.]|uniref:hypothetical protein n=1 Tax=Fodinibius sp. TaxID=1872440 RepID=UPI002ACE7F1A|nr:hypothetical protein [Fodinibius sp.]MDZ7659101.1 hypothetical protein [Fodinibius sp.]